MHSGVGVWGWYIYKVNCMKMHKADATNLVKSPTIDNTLKLWHLYLGHSNVMSDINLGMISWPIISPKPPPLYVVIQVGAKGSQVNNWFHLTLGTALPIFHQYKHLNTQLFIQITLGHKYSKLLFSLLLLLTLNQTLPTPSQASYLQ